MAAGSHARGRQRRCPRNEDRAELAVENFRQGLYCSEAIVKAFADAGEAGLGPDALRMATAFGAGLGGAKCVCGSLTGAAMVVGARLGRSEAEESEQPAFEAVKLLHDRFRGLHGATCCRRLTRAVEWGTPGHHVYCEQFVRTAVELVEEILANAGTRPGVLGEVTQLKAERKEGRA